MTTNNDPKNRKTTGSFTTNCRRSRIIYEFLRLETEMFEKNCNFLCEFVALNNTSESFEVFSCNMTV